MFVRLTNGSKGYEGMAVAINTQVIVSVYESKDIELDKVHTVVYSPDTTWVVQETVDEVVAKIKYIDK